MYDEFGNLIEAPATDSGFFAAARERVSSFLQPVGDFASSPAGSQLFNAIYEFGRGKIDAAREKAVGAFLMTSEGKKVQATATRQTLNQYMPVFLAIGAGILFLFLITFSRR